MPEPRRLRNPPITEAILDFRVELGVGFDATRLREAESLLSAGYVLQGEQHLFVQTFTVGGDPGVAPGHATPALTGYTFRSGDGRFIAQLTVEGVTVSQLHGYARWEDLSGEAARVWDVYSRVAEPKRVLRLGTRYLNTIRVPLPPHALELEEYFTTLPQIPAGVPERVTNFLVRMVLNEDEPPFSVSITQYLEPTDPDFVRMILDIDAFSRETYEMDAGTMWGVFAGLRDLKNRVFFGSVTEKTLEMFE